MDSRTDKSNENGEHRSFNVLGKSFQIRLNDLARYPTSLLADNIRLQEYWRPSLHAYFFSRDVRIFESIILPFYTKFKSWERIKRPSMILLSEKRFQNELAFYNLLEYYQIDDILNNIFEHCTQSSSIVFLFSRLLIQKCLCQCIIDCISCVSCAMGICELMLWRCRERSISLLVTDIFISLILLWTLFYEQYSDKILLKIQFDMHSKHKEKLSSIREKKSFNKKYVIIASCQSSSFFMQIIFTSLSFIISLLSYKHTGTWYFVMALALRHLLLIRLCLRDMYHLVDLLCYSGRLSFRVFSHFLLFLATVTFMCIWIGIILYVTDSSSMTNYSIDHRTSLTPSRYIYFVYHILLNVGYGDTVEQSILSFIMIIIMTLVACPLLIIIYRNLIKELNIVKTKMSHVETLHRTSFINHLRTKINSYHKSIVN
ncbi:unnamed protein product [Rotaria magnacalcarata]|uniref:Potassium channel tetramerisation-type BTB domain-containing protein n=1 Tax=Rotaria magnacalcarata TaxID=392030 RepID=A0A816FVN5_9BILA|nr:unnamed protein product [Rotaria magnacalcarata]CAF1666084.1 unnamed protein product [Rotaria magnacalcarata]CAF2135346.1 unnamed protein product [Rotaria magnacalcarata]CAF3790950.1 unnamed protein product [Rotaria magnacalcarata]CAF3791251.1 unnamed protein product [Rotaria magnacalcarata]